MTTPTPDAPTPAAPDEPTPDEPATLLARAAALLVDLDNTLVDRDAALAAWLATIVPGDAVARIVAVDRGGYGPKPALFRALAAAAGLSPAEARRRFFRELPAFTRVRPDAAALLDAYDGRVVVVTNGPGELQRAKLAASGLDARVDAAVISGELGVEKPDAAIFRAALARAGRASRPIGAREAVMVGDHPRNDVAGARAVGIPAVFVRSPWFADPPGVPAITALTELLHLRRTP